MSRLPMKARLLARAALPNRGWFPIEAWDDERYHKAFPRMRATDDQLQAQRDAVASGALDGGPTFSVIVPLFRTTREYLDDVTGSVLDQTYPKLQLVLVNASPDFEDLSARVDAYAARDPRVTVVRLSENLGITENTNHGIAAATGDFVCFLDHDDWIEPDALYHFAMAVLENDEIDLLYCDEDNVVRDGAGWHYSHPFFKPDFSPEHLMCKNYIIHLLTVRKSIVDAMPRPGREFDGSQDYNMTLYASEKARCVHHVPKVLYHWRMSEASTADNPTAKPYAKTSNRLSVWRHLQRTGANGRIVSSGIASLHNIWFAADGTQRVSVIAAVCHGRAAAFFGDFLQTNTYPNCQVVLVEPDMPAAKADLGGFPEEPDATSCDVVRVNAPEGASLTALLNEGARHADGDILVFMDDSCSFATAQPVEQLVGFHNLQGLGIVGPRVLYADCSVKSYGVGVTSQAVMPLYRGYDRTYPSYHCSTRAFQNASAASWQGLSVKRSAFDQAGGFDEGLASEIAAADLCQQVIGQGQRLAVVCTVELLTQEFPPDRRFDANANRPDYPPEDVERLFAKRPELRQSDDPYISPNLDQTTGYPSINPQLLG